MSRILLVWPITLRSLFRVVCGIFSMLMMEDYHMFLHDKSHGRGQNDKTSEDLC